MIETGVILIEGNQARRQELTRFLATKNVHVEPFESVAEYAEYPLQGALFLVADEGEQVREMISMLEKANQFPALVAYHDTVDSVRIVDAMRSGVSDYLTWPLESSRLAEKLAGLRSRQTNVSMMKAKILRAKRKLDCLTDRELQIMAMMAEGYSSKEIALQLEISYRTVEVHRANMMLKLKAKNVVQVVRLAIESNFDDSDEVSVAA